MVNLLYSPAKESFKIVRIFYYHSDSYMYKPHGRSLLDSHRRIGRYDSHIRVLDELTRSLVLQGAFYRTDRLRLSSEVKYFKKDGIKTTSRYPRVDLVYPEWGFL